MYYGLLGEHLSHSYSPLIHSMLGDYEYRLIEKSPDELWEFIKNGDFAALNVTIPYKKAVIPYLSALSERAERIGSVNVIVRREDGSLYGDNSDYFGFLSLVRKAKISVAGKKVLVLGSGGASATVKAVLSDLSAREITVVSRTGEDNYENIEKHADCDVIVNTTPVGMFPNCPESIVDLRKFPRLSGVLDLIYNPCKTALVLQAEELGIPALGGLHMLAAQGVKAYEMFFGCSAPEGAVDKAEKALNGKMKNIALIGMPGCGKTSVGKRLAKLTKREFVDIDKEIVARAKKTIPKIFEEDGEEAFRALETEVLRDICKKSSLVISTGGGVVTRKENRPLLLQNSFVVYIGRPLSALSKKGRPLSAKKSPEELWQERGARYKEWSTLKVCNTGITPTAIAIAKGLHLETKKRK